MLSRDASQTGREADQVLRPDGPFRVVRLSSHVRELIFPADRTGLIFILGGRIRALGDFGEVEAHAGQVLSIKRTVSGSAIGNDRVEAYAIFFEHEYVVGMEYWSYAHAFVDREHARRVMELCDTDETKVFDVGAGTLSGLRSTLARLAKSESIGRSHGLVSNALSILPERRFFFIDGCLEHVKSRPGIRREAIRVARLLREQYRERWTLEGLGRRVNLSRAQLVRVFLDGYGVTPAQYLTRVRVERMADLLAETSLSVSEVARSCGWADRGHATAVFTQRMRMTPRQFRLAQQPN